MTLPGYAWIAIHRAQNRWWDLRARLAGYCNHCPDPTNIPGQGGGYRWWRCARRRSHDGMHRTGNYVWTDDGTTTYLPAPHPDSHQARQPWKRNSTPTRRQARALDRWVEQQHAARRASRQEPTR